MADFKKLLKDHMLKSAGYETGQFDIKKQMAKFDIKPEEIGLGNSLSPNYNF